MKNLITILCIILLASKAELFSNAPYSYSPRVLYNLNVFSNSSSLLDLPSVRSVNGILKTKLHVKAFKMETPIFGVTTRAFCFEDSCSVPGPSLFVRPGDFVALTVINTLETNTESKANHSNVILRGLHLDVENNGLGYQTIAKDNSIELSFRIPVDHAAGTYWYHSFVNGVEAMQVMGGLFGAVVVQSAVSLPAELEAMERRLLVFSHINLNDKVHSKSAPTLQSLSADYRSSLPLDIDIRPVLHHAAQETNVHTVTHISDAWLTNGLYQPYITMYAEEWKIFDILVVSPYRMIELEIRSAVGHDAGEYSCDVRLLALDGVYLSATRRGQYVNHLPVLPGGRATLAVMCPIKGTYYLQSACVVDDGRDGLSNFSRIGNTYTKSTQNLATIVVSDAFSLVWLPPPDSLLSIPRPAYLRSLLTSPVDSHWSISTETAGCCQKESKNSTGWIGIGRDCRPACWSELDCFARYGSNYSVLQTPAVTLNHCKFYSYSEFTSPKTDAVAVSWPDAPNALHSSVNEVSVWSRAPFPSSLRFFSQPLQLVHYDSLGLAHGQTQGDFRDVGVDDSLFYSLPGDWRDTFPGLVGKLTLRSVFPVVGTQLLGSNTLLDSDGGMLFSVKVSPVLGLPSDVEIDTSGSVDASVSPDGDAWKLKIKTCNPQGDSSFYKEIIDVANNARILTTNSCPDHFNVCQQATCGGNTTYALATVKSIRVPLNPVLTPFKKDTTCSSDIVAIAFNGVSIKSPFNAAEHMCHQPIGWEEQIAAGKTSCNFNGDGDGILYCGDLLSTSYSTSIDKCGGMANFADGSYSYLIPPVCLLASLMNKHSLTNQVHSPAIGWALDGFPIYGPTGPGGAIMKRCGLEGAHPVYCLDNCNGWRGELPAVDAFLYRYYSTGSVSNGNCNHFVDGAGKCSRISDDCCASNIPSSEFWPYTIGCFHGCLYNDASCILDSTRGTTLRYSPKGENFFYNDTTSDAVSSCLSESSVHSKDRIRLNISTAQIGAKDAYLRQKSQRKAAANLRTVIRNPHNDNLSIVSFNESSESLRNSMIFTDLPTRAGDAFVTGVVEEASTRRLFYAQPSGIFSVLNSEDEHIIAGMISINISGYNLGQNPAELLSITVKGVECTSIEWISSRNLFCYSSRRGAVTGVLAEDVTVSTAGGTANGPYAEPLTVFRSGTGRPVIASVAITAVPFKPHAVTISSPLFPSDHHNNKITYPSSLYFSNVGVGGYSIVRCKLDGSQLEVIVSNVQKAYGLAVIAGGIRPAETRDSLLFVDANKGILVRVKLEPLRDSVIYHNQQNTEESFVVLSNLDTPTAVVTNFDSGFVFVSLLGGSVLKLSLLQVLDTTVPLSMLDKRAVQVMTRGQSNARMVSLCASSVSINPMVSLSSTKSTWSFERLFAIEMNRQIIYAFSESGDLPTTMQLSNLGFGRNVPVWPSACTVSNQDSSVKTTTLIVADYLGKIWKLILPFGENGKIIKSELKSPKVLLDKSNFPASQLLRGLMELSTEHEVSKSIFCDVIS